MSCQQCINSIDRALLNQGLLGEASALPNIHMFFEHKVQTVDFDKKVMVVRKSHSDQNIHVDFDLCIGADGSYSVIRRQLMRVVRSALIYIYILGVYADSSQHILHISHALEWISNRNISHMST